MVGVWETLDLAEAQRGRQRLQLMDLRLVVAGEELEGWVALAVGAETELKVQLPEAAWVAAWMTGPGVSLQGGLREVVLRVEDLSEEREQSQGLNSRFLCFLISILLQGSTSICSHDLTATVCLPLHLSL